MKRIGWLLGISILLGSLGSNGWAYPDKPIKFIIGYEAGSSSDHASRAIAPILEKDLGQPIMIVNKPGAASSMAMREVHASKPDGYTVGVSSSINVLKIQKLMDVDHHGFDVIGVPSVTWPIIGVPSSSRWRSLKDCLADARANPGKYRLSTTAKGAAFWIAARYFENTAKVQFKIISNPGGAGFVATQLGGVHVELGVASVTPLRSQMDAGLIRILGIMGSSRLAAPHDKFPTLKEEGVDCIFGVWQAYVAPKGLPEEVYKRLVEAFRRAASSPEYHQWCIANGRTPSPQYQGEEGVNFLDRDLEIERPILESMK
jgi:tripartite-type tricarboxylate transporter receptor subunit TctC